jgi:hypothetical protein
MVSIFILYIYNVNLECIFAINFIILGSVYKAKNKTTHIEVAVKILPDSGDDLNSLKQEIEFLKRLSSPYGEYKRNLFNILLCKFMFSISSCFSFIMSSLPVVSYIESYLYDAELWVRGTV